jgi:HlyD family secretion protein
MKNTFTESFGKVGSYLKRHKIQSAILVIIIIISGYYGYKKATAQVTPTKYVLSTVERGTLINSISGTGQVSASNQVDLKPKVSGTVTSVNVKAGQEVKAGAVIAHIDSRDAYQSVKDAEADLISAKISLEKTKTSSTQTSESAQDSLTKAYDDAFSTLTDTYTSLNKIVADANDILNNPRHSAYMENEQIRSIIGNTGVDQKLTVQNSFGQAKVAYDALYSSYKTVSRTSDKTVLTGLLDKTYTVSKQLTDAIKQVRAIVGSLESASTVIPTQLTTDKNTLDSDVGNINSDVSGLLSAQTSIKDAENNLEKAEQTYSQISGSTNPLDVQTAELVVTQKQNAYQKTLNTLSDYTVRAPFDGVVASVDAKVGDSGSSGTAVGTIITPQQIATVTLTEIDVAKIAVGQKVTLTFDALSDLSISGQVIEVAGIGTVSQGVVSYEVKIGFDTQDSQVKPGMSVSAAIITESKPDVLLVPSGAVKTSAAGSYVEVIDDGVGVPQTGVTSKAGPHQVPVEIGSTSDSQVEIISGLTEGQTVVSRTVTSTTKTTATTGTTQRTGGATIFGGSTRATP